MMKRLLMSFVMALSLFSGIAFRASAMSEVAALEWTHHASIAHRVQAQPLPPGTPELTGYDCTLPLRVTLRQGPDAGLVLFGMVGMNFDATGGATGVYDVMAPADHVGQVPMFGQIVGRSVSMMFNVTDKLSMYGVGTSQDPLTSNCHTQWGGPVVGFGDGDTGDWVCTPDLCCGGGVCMICQLVGSTNVCVRHPTQTQQN